MKTFVFDLDGTMYRGTQPIESAVEFVNGLHEKGIPYLFLTNNAMRTKEQNAKKLADMGVKHVRPEMFYTSAMAAAEYAASLNQGKKAFMIGEAGLEEALHENGFEITESDPDFVAVGLSRNEDYHSYSKAVKHLLNGAKLVGTNNDRILATEHGFDLGNGSVVAMFEYCSGQKSERIGKPYAPILNLFLKHFGLDKEDIILVGDNLETDIALGYNNHVNSIFVQTGVHTQSDLERFDINPDFVVGDLSEIDADQFI